MISTEQIEVLGLSRIASSTLKYNLDRKDLRITFVYNIGKWKIIGRYKHAPFLEPVKQVSYIDEQSLINFAKLAIDEGKPTSFKVLVIDSIISHLKEKRKKIIDSN